MDSVKVEYFDTSDENINVIKKLIKEQGLDTCKKEISRTVLLEYISNFQFGFLFKKFKANTGLSFRSNRNKVHLYSFVLCRIGKDKELRIDLICNRNVQKKIGSIFMDTIDDYCRQNGIDKIRLFAIDKSALLKWYTTQGFTIIDKILLPDGSVKVYHM